MPGQKQPTIRLQWTFHGITAPGGRDLQRSRAFERPEDLLSELLSERFREAFPGLETPVLTSSCIEVCSRRWPSRPGGPTVRSTISFDYPDIAAAKPVTESGGIVLSTASGSLKASGTLRDHGALHDSIELLHARMLIEPSAIPLLVPSNLTLVVKVTLGMLPAITAGVVANTITGVFRKVRAGTRHEKTTERINGVIIRRDEIIIGEVERTYDKR